MAAENEQQQLSFEGKPWSEARHAKNVEEANVLKDTRSFLYTQIRGIDDRLRVLNTEILDHILAKTSEPPAASDYGKTETGLDLEARPQEPPRFSPKGIIRNFHKRVV